MAIAPAQSRTRLKVRPVDKASWKDFEKLFSARGSPGYCWCMLWRMTKEELKHNNSASKKKFMRHRVTSGTPVGLLGYAGDDPVAWCSIAPRDTYQRLGGDEAIERVWSIACFFITRPHRDQGLVHELIGQAKKYAKKHGAKYLEAYPVKPDSPSYRFMGFIPVFKKAGFTFVKMAGSRRNVMTCKL